MSSRKVEEVKGMTRRALRATLIHTENEIYMVQTIRLLFPVDNMSYETMVFIKAGNGEEVYTRNYFCETCALEGHQEAVDKYMGVE